jgi:hypothetical protein
LNFSESTATSNNNLSFRSRHSTIVSLAKNYRIHYIKMLKDITSNQSDKRSLESPTMTRFKRQRSSSNYDNSLQTLRNRIQNEENEQFYFNDERRM